MGERVEWALHCCFNLGFVGPDVAVTAARLAAFHGLPAAYLNKQLQAMARAGIVESSQGPGGGFRLARSPQQITLMDVVTAIEGPDPAFRCTEIRERGPAGMWGTSQRACTIDAAMRQADLAWRRSLAGQTVADLMATFQNTYPAMPDRIKDWFTTAHA